MKGDIIFNGKESVKEPTFGDLKVGEFFIGPQSNKLFIKTIQKNGYNAVNLHNGDSLFGFQNSTVIINQKAVKITVET